jgi:hypothetical protein
MSCQVWRRIGADCTRFSRRDDETAKNARYAVAGDDFKPI